MASGAEQRYQKRIKIIKAYLATYNEDVIFPRSPYDKDSIISEFSISDFNLDNLIFRYEEGGFDGLRDGYVANKRRVNERDILKIIADDEYGQADLSTKTIRDAKNSVRRKK